MVRCDHCGAETTMPFSCQYCGGSFCDTCRLPPNHDCRNISEWRRKPSPFAGATHRRGGGAAPMRGGYADTRVRLKASEARLPYLRIMIAIIVLIVIGLIILGLSGLHGV